MPPLSKPLFPDVADASPHDHREEVRLFDALPAVIGSIIDAIRRLASAVAEKI